MSKLANNADAKLPTWFTQSFNERIVAEVEENLREEATAEEAPQLPDENLDNHIAAESRSESTETVDLAPASNEDDVETRAEAEVELKTTAPAPGLTAIDEERMAQYRAELHRRMEEIRMSHLEHAQPMMQSVPSPRMRRASAAPEHVHVQAPRRELSTLATAGLVVAVLAVGAGIGYLVSFAQILPTGLAFFEAAGQKVEARQSVSVAPAKTVTATKPVIAAAAVKEVDHSSSQPAILDLAAPEANTTVIYKMSGVPAAAYLTSTQAMPAQDLTLKPIGLPKAKSQAKIAIEADAPAWPPETSQTAKPLDLAVEPPAGLVNGEVRIEPAASKPGNTIKP